MKFQTIFTAVAALAMTVAPALAVPEPEPVPETFAELDNDLESRAQCRPGHHLVGSGCSPGAKGHTSCSSNDRAVVICTGKGPTWQVQNKCQKGSCNNNCVCT